MSGISRIQKLSMLTLLSLLLAGSAKLEYDSNKKLHEKKNVSDYTLENSLNDYRQAQAAVAQAKAAVEQAKASVAQAKA